MHVSDPILRLALPSVVANISAPLLGLADTAIAGHTATPRALAAVAIGTTILNTLYWLLGFLRMGTTGLTARACSVSAAWLALRRSLTLALTLALVLLALQEPLWRLTAWLMEPDAATAREAATYFHIAVWGAPAVLAGYGLTGWFVGMQDTRTPMWTALGQNLLNIAATCTLVFGLGLGVAGMALGTVFGLYGGLAFALLRVHGEHSVAGREEEAPAPPTPSASVAATQESAAPSAPIVYLHIFLRTLCLVAVTVSFTSVGSRQGALCLGANALLMQFFVVYSYFTDGLANAAEALCGPRAADRPALLLIVRRLFRLGLLLALSFTLLYALFGPALLGLLTRQPDILLVARTHLPWLVAVPLVALPAFLWDGVCVGLTATRPMLLSMLAAAALFFASQALCGASNHALWLSFLLCLFCRSLAQTIWFLLRYGTTQVGRETIM